MNAQADGCVVDSGSCDFVQMANFECDCGTVKDCLLLACNATDAPCPLPTGPDPAKTSAANVAGTGLTGVFVWTAVVSLAWRV